MCFVYEGVVQGQTEENFENFYLGVGLQEIGIPEILRLSVSKERQLHGFQNVRFDSLSQAVPLVLRERRNRFMGVSVEVVQFPDEWDFDGRKILVGIHSV